MATTYTLTSGQFAAHAKALTASSVDKVVWPADVDTITVVSDGTAAIHVRFDGVDPTVNGASSFIIPASAGPVMRTFRPADLPGDATHTKGASEVRLISVGTPTYSVEGA